MHTSKSDGAIPLNHANQINCLNANIRKASRAILSLYMNEMRDSDLKGTQFTLLSTIAGFGNITVNTLANYMAMDQTTVTRNITLLKKEGLVNVVSGEDRRKRVISLTQKGVEAIDHTQPLWLAAQTKVWNQLGPEKAEQLLNITNTICQLAEER